MLTLKPRQLFLLFISMFVISEVQSSNNRGGWAWTCDELENIHSEIQDKYGLSELFKNV